MAETVQRGDGAENGSRAPCREGGPGRDAVTVAVAVAAADDARAGAGALRVVADALVCATLAYLDLVTHLRLRRASRWLSSRAARPESAPARVSMVVPGPERAPSVLRSLLTLRLTRLELKEDPDRPRGWAVDGSLSLGLDNDSLASLGRMTWLRELTVRIHAKPVGSEMLMFGRKGEAQGQLLAPLLNLRALSITLDCCGMNLATLASLSQLSMLSVAFWNFGGGGLPERPQRRGDDLAVALECMPQLRSLRLSHEGVIDENPLFSWERHTRCLPPGLSSLHLGASSYITRDFSAGLGMIAHLKEVRTLELGLLKLSRARFVSLLRQHPAVACVRVRMISDQAPSGAPGEAGEDGEDEKDVLRVPGETPEAGEGSEYLATPLPQLRHLRLFASVATLRWCTLVLPNLRTIHCNLLRAGVKPAPSISPAISPPSSTATSTTTAGKTDLPHLESLTLRVASVNDTLLVLAQGWHAPKLGRLTLSEPLGVPGIPAAKLELAALAAFPNLRSLHATGVDLDLGLRLGLGEEPGSKVRLGRSHAWVPARPPTLPRLLSLETLFCESSSIHTTVATRPSAGPGDPKATAINLAFPALRSLYHRVNNADGVSALLTTVQGTGDSRRYVRAVHTSATLRPWVTRRSEDDEQWIPLETPVDD